MPTESRPVEAVIREAEQRVAQLPICSGFVSGYGISINGRPTCRECGLPHDAHLVRDLLAALREQEKHAAAHNHARQIAEDREILELREQQSLAAKLAAAEAEIAQLREELAHARAKS